MTPGPVPPAGSPAGRPPRRRRRRRFSLNALAIQLSAVALSFTLVALLVVSGSQAAFVEPNQSVLEYVPVGTAAPTAGTRRPAGRPPTPPAEAPVPVAAALPAPGVREEVELTDSHAGTAMFGNETLTPGLAEDRCIDVTYAGDAEPGPVLLYAGATSGELTPYLDLTIDLGRAEAGSSGGCGNFTRSATLYDGTLADFAVAHSSYASGRATWKPADEEDTRSFRFSVTVQDVPDAMGKSASFGFSWETRAS
jgi:hypothetical protein